MRPLAVLALLALSAAPLAAAHAAPAGGNPPVTTFTLDNGLEIVVIEDHRAPVITHMVWYRVGSADEEPGKTGIAHFLEHLMFQGTETVAPGEFSKEIARNGGRDNAFTSYDYTAYHQRIASDRLELVMRLEADRMANLKLSEDDVRTEREVVLEERASRFGNNPNAQLREQMDAALYLAHPYMHPIIGWEAEVHGLTREDAVRFYERFYTPSNAILVVAGDVEPERVHALAETYYGVIENRATVGPRLRPGEPPAQAERRVVMKDPRASPERIRRTYLVPAVARAESGEAEALEVLGEILGSGPTSRIYRTLVVERKLAVDAGAYYSGNSLDYGEFTVNVPVGPGADFAEVEAAVDTLIADIARDGVTGAELELAKTQIIADTIFDQDSQSRMARTFGAALATGSTVEDVLAWPERIRAVTADEVRKAAAWLVPERSVTGTLRRPAAGERS